MGVLNKLTLDSFTHSLAALPTASRYVLALSGGLDSVVLLKLFALLREKNADLPLAAVHVHHGLNPRADDWVVFCQSLCHKLAVSLTVSRIDINPAPGESLEAAARHGRYRALAASLAAGEALVTAHHANDQGETFLLQALRGAGVAGLAAMPPARLFAAGWLLRPLLAWTRGELAAWAGGQGLSWIEDDSNRDLSFDRNFLRHEVMPLLEGRWPGLAHTLGRACALQREARALLDELAAADLAGCLDEDSGAGRLSIPPLLPLSRARQAGLLRYWLRLQGVQVPDHDRLDQVIDSLLPARDDGQPRVAWADVELRRYRQQLYLLRRQAAPDPALNMDWDLQGSLEIPGLGSLRLCAADRPGLSAARLSGQRGRVSLRQGGESLSPAGRGGHHELKKLFQEAGIPPWERQRLPLLYIGAELVAVAGLWIAEGWQARGDEAAAVLEFCPAAPQPVSSADGK